MKTQILAHYIAAKIFARSGSLKAGNLEWFNRHTESINKAVSQFMPSGSGFDNGTTIDLSSGDGSRLIFTTSFHHMNPDGFYTHWTEHKVTVKPDLVFGFTVQVSGRNDNDVKSYIGDVFHDALSTRVDANGEAATEVTSANREGARFAELLADWRAFDHSDRTKHATYAEAEAAFSRLRRDLDAMAGGLNVAPQGNSGLWIRFDTVRPRGSLKPGGLFTVYANEHNGRAANPEREALALHLARSASEWLAQHG
jgi:hypothetical protein